MQQSLAFFFKMFGRPGWLGIVLLTILAACSNKPDVNPAGQQQNLATTKSVMPESGLLNALPAPYNKLGEPIVGGACGFDDLAPPSQGKSLVSGWVLIDAKAGVVPEKIILRLDQAGTEMYIVLQPVDRLDVVKFFKNPALLKTGFYAEIPSPTFNNFSSITAMQTFQGKLYMCATKQKV